MAELHLSIKTEYLTQLKAGVKRIEYREDTPYWSKRFKKQFKIASFHQYKGTLISFKILKVERIKRPSFITLFRTPYCWAIYLDKEPIYSKV